MADADLFAEYSDFAKLIHSDEVRRAFRHLMEEVLRLTSFEIRPAPHGNMNQAVGLFWNDEHPYDVDVRRKWLTFYIRFAQRTDPRILAELKSSFPGAERKQGYFRFQVRTVAEARSVMRIVFGREDESAGITYPDEIFSNSPLVEGAAKSVLVNCYERNPKARRECIAHYGYRCSVCDLNFADVYGEIGEGFIHVHHLVEISSIGQEYEVDPVRDLRPVCPNCHALLHRRMPPLTIEELKQVLRARLTLRFGLPKLLYD